jgi:predicted nuclease of predicted toxin-antitoxin system
MRILADLHIATSTVRFLRQHGHDVVRVTDRLPANASDHQIVDVAIAENWVVLSQDLDFSAIVALSGKTSPSVIQLRLATVRIETVNAALERILPALETQVSAGVLATVEEDRLRIRRLPLA